MLKFGSCRAIAVVSVVVSQFGLVGVSQAAEFTEAKYRELHKTLQPGDKPWRTIPWKIDLLDAQRAAAKQRKPIFIWAMDGHPLGCT